MSFWSIDDLDLTDALNDEIWRESPVRGAALKARLHLENHGGLQELRGGLPWVPDLVGRRWGEEGSVLVIGSAYAPFIHDNRTSNRRLSHRAMDLTDYANAALKPPKEFLERFFSTVVKDDRAYYERIGALLCGIVAPDRVLLTDLCRASFVRPDELGQVKGGDAAVQYDPEVYGDYVEANEDWTWKRIKQCAGGVIVTLGDIAEQGLLAMFRRQDYDLSIPTAPHVTYNPVRPGDRGQVTSSAQNTTAQKRRQAGWWWQAVRGDQEYRIVPAAHPARHNDKRNDYRWVDSRALICAARAGVTPLGVERPATLVQAPVAQALPNSFGQREFDGPLVIGGGEPTPLLSHSTLAQPRRPPAAPYRATDRWRALLSVDHAPPVGQLLARHPDVAALTRRLVASLTVERLIVIADTLHNKCRISEMEDTAPDNPGRQAEFAWRALLAGLTKTHERPSGWTGAAKLLAPGKETGLTAAAQLDIGLLAGVCAKIVSGPYREANARGLR